VALYAYVLFLYVYVVWGALGEEELPQELKLNKFEKLP